MTLTAATVTPAATKIMLIRHAEKPQSNPPLQGVDINGEPDNESLIVLGWQRAGALVVYFAPSLGPFQNSEIETPQFIYASNVTSGSDSKRPQETVTPLIDKLGSGNVTVKLQLCEGKEAGKACRGVGDGV